MAFVGPSLFIILQCHSDALHATTSIMTLQPVFNISYFERVTTQKLTHYYAVAQMNYSGDTTPELSPSWDRRLNADPNNLTTFPPNTLTEKVVNDFYAICDTICDRCDHASPNTRISEFPPLSNILLSGF